MSTVIRQLSDMLMVNFGRLYQHRGIRSVYFHWSPFVAQPFPVVRSKVAQGAVCHRFVGLAESRVPKREVSRKTLKQI